MVVFGAKKQGALGCKLYSIGGRTANGMLKWRNLAMALYYRSASVYKRMTAQENKMASGSSNFICSAYYLHSVEQYSEFYLGGTAFMLGVARKLLTALHRQ